MKKNELISNTSYGVRLRELVIDDLIDFEYYYELRDTYDGFLLTELNISMFVPAIFEGGKWVVLEEPKVDKHNDDWFSDAEEFEQAKDKVIFDGFEVVFKNQYGQEYYVIERAERIMCFTKDGLWYFGNETTIQDLTKKNLTLTPRGMKDSGIK